VHFVFEFAGVDCDDDCVGGGDLVEASTIASCQYPVSKCWPEMFFTETDS